MKIEYLHTLSVDEAIKRLKKFSDEAKEKYKDQIQEVTEEWEANKGKFMLKAMGSKAKGDIEVLEGRILANVKLPLIAKPFEKQIEKMIIDIFKDLLND